MIKSAEELENRKIEIDLRGPEGNVFVLIGAVGRIGKQLGWCGEAIEMVRGMMMLGDYENALNIFDHHFGDHVTLYR